MTVVVVVVVLVLLTLPLVIVIVTVPEEADGEEEEEEEEEEEGLKNTDEGRIIPVPHRRHVHFHEREVTFTKPRVIWAVLEVSRVVEARVLFVFVSVSVVVVVVVFMVVVISVLGLVVRSVVSDDG